MDRGGSPDRAGHIRQDSRGRLRVRNAAICAQAPPHPIAVSRSRRCPACSGYWRRYAPDLRREVPKQGGPPANGRVSMSYDPSCPLHPSPASANTGCAAALRIWGYHTWRHPVRGSPPRGIYLAKITVTAAAIANALYRKRVRDLPITINKRMDWAVYFSCPNLDTFERPPSAGEISHMKLYVTYGSPYARL